MLLDYVTLLPQSEVQHRVGLPWETNETIEIPVPAVTAEYPRGKQASYESQNPVDVKQYGPTTPGPLGWVVGGRSGDKASDANVYELPNLLFYWTPLINNM
jgi:hypothetical protein